MVGSWFGTAAQDLQKRGGSFFRRRGTETDPRVPLKQPTSPPTGVSALGDRRLLLISNREPYVRRRTEGVERLERTTGGLVTALDPVMRSSGGVWIAWQPDGDAGAATRFQVPAEEPQFTLRQVPLTRKEVSRYYHGFANSALWPLCHYFIGRCRFEEAEWRQYVEINRRFADTVLEETRPGDLIWVHDYHFCLLPEMIRERRRDAGPLAFFLHIPFPAEEVFRILPWRRQVLAGLLGADLVGFHTAEYAGDFMGCCERLLGAAVDHDRGIVVWQGREVRVGAFPIGIDVDEFAALADGSTARDRVARLRRGLGVEKLILGVDRLDYSQGIPERLHAIDVLLQARPDLRGTFVFLQVAVPSRTQVKEYGELKREIDEMVGRVNGRHGTASWQPVRYLYRSVPRQELVAYYRAADVCLVTPLRDGMNLVAMEYAACRTDGDGVLVLLELTGAAHELGQGAIQVNPFAVHDMADALAEALAMPLDDRRRRMALLRERVRSCDVHGWLDRILRAAVGEPPPDRWRPDRSS
jgi:alpha,alpha-trehalose-phosphate synthase [UDP-forming]